MRYVGRVKQQIDWLSVCLQLFEFCRHVRILLLYLVVVERDMSPHTHTHTRFAALCPGLPG